MFFFGRWIEACEACGGPLGCATTDDVDAEGRRILTCGCTNVLRHEREKAKLLDAFDRSRRAELRRSAR